MFMIWNASVENSVNTNQSASTVFVWLNTKCDTWSMQKGPLSLCVCVFFCCFYKLHPESHELIHLWVDPDPIMINSIRVLEWGQKVICFFSKSGHVAYQIKVEEV